MRILSISERPPYPFFLGGAARCAHEIMHTLATDMKVECMAIGSADFANPPWVFPNATDCEVLGIRNFEGKGSEGNIDCGYPVQVIANFHERLDVYIDDYRPDVIWAQLEGALFVIDTARKKGVHSLLFVHDAEFDPQELRVISRMTSGIVCSSQFLARKVQKVVHRKAQVVYPCPRVDFGVIGDVNGCLTMINPHRVKGLDTFLEIARRLPDEQFLLVESWKLTDEDLCALRELLHKLPNISFVRRVPDMRQIYKRTRLLLVPSVWEEGFGMVVVEAQSCRIPVIASARGGLTEAVGNGGILIGNYKNPEQWVKEISHLLGDKSVYDDLAQRAFDHAHQELFSTAGSAHRFLEYCTSLFAKEVGRKKGSSIFAPLSGLARRLGF